MPPAFAAGEGLGGGGKGPGAGARGAHTRRWRARFLRRQEAQRGGSARRDGALESSCATVTHRSF
eukprot:1941911-Rhodomonas_salina.2